METEDKIFEVAALGPNGDPTKHRYKQGKKIAKISYHNCTSLETKFEYIVNSVQKAALATMKQKQGLVSRIRIHRYLKHNNIIDLVRFFEDSTTVYIIFEYFKISCINISTDLEESANSSQNQSHSKSSMH